MEKQIIEIGDELFYKGDVKNKECYHLQDNEVYTRWLVSYGGHYYILSILKDDNSNIVYRGVECYNSIQRAIDVYFSTQKYLNDDFKEEGTW